jgi:hypothetical protein
MLVREQAANVSCDERQWVGRWWAMDFAHDLLKVTLVTESSKHSKQDDLDFVRERRLREVQAWIGTRDRCSLFLPLLTT